MLTRYEITVKSDKDSRIRLSSKEYGVSGVTYEPAFYVNEKHVVIYRVIPCVVPYDAHP